VTTPAASDGKVLVKYPYIGGTRWNFMKWADIPEARDRRYVYLRRLRIVQTPWFAVYLHWIMQPDEDRDPHDHPFAFWSLIVRGGYTERVWRVLRGQTLLHAIDHGYTHNVWSRWSWHKMDQDHAHMVSHLQPGTITLVVAGPKRANGRWGFYTSDGFIAWKPYNRLKYGSESTAQEANEWA